MGIERRYSLRIPIPEDQSGAVLRVGQRRIAVRLLDASSFGFGVACPPNFSARAGDLFQLWRAAGWVEVRVVRVEAKGKETRLGLAVVRELRKDPDSGWYDAIGGRAVATVLIAAFTIGLGFGATMFLKSKDGWKQVQQAVERLTSHRH